MRVPVAPCLYFFKTLRGKTVLGLVIFIKYFKSVMMMKTSRRYTFVNYWSYSAVNFPYKKNQMR
jgi:hypothetical protein